MKPLFVQVLVILAIATASAESFIECRYSESNEPVTGVIMPDEDYSFVLSNSYKDKGLTELEWRMEYAIHADSEQYEWVPYYTQTYDSYAEDHNLKYNRDKFFTEVGIPCPENPVDGMVAAEDGSGVKARVLFSALLPSGEEVCDTLLTVVDWRPSKFTYHIEVIDMVCTPVNNSMYSDDECSYVGSFNIVVDEAPLAQSYCMYKINEYGVSRYDFEDSIYAHTEGSIYMEFEIYVTSQNKFGSCIVDGDIIVVKDFLASVQPLYNDCSIKVYPTIATTHIEIESATGVQEVAIYSLAGQCVHRGNDTTLSVADLASGCYLVQVVLEDGEKSTHRIIKK